jgi:DnaJ-class molecular chaperone
MMVMSTLPNVFKEIKEAYEILVESSKRKAYDDRKNSDSYHRQNNKQTQQK